LKRKVNDGLNVVDGDGNEKQVPSGLVKDVKAHLRRQKEHEARKHERHERRKERLKRKRERRTQRKREMKLAGVDTRNLDNRVNTPSISSSTFGFTTSSESFDGHNTASSATGSDGSLTEIQGIKQRKKAEKQLRILKEILVQKSRRGCISISACIFIIFITSIWLSTIEEHLECNFTYLNSIVINSDFISDLIFV
jgi:hypothetical protein